MTKRGLRRDRKRAEKWAYRVSLTVGRRTGDREGLVGESGIVIDVLAVGVDVGIWLLTAARINLHVLVVVVISTVIADEGVGGEGVVVVGLEVADGEHSEE
jgi:hypothetical protein